MPEPRVDRWHADIVSVTAGILAAAGLSLVMTSSLIDRARQLSVGTYLVIAAVSVLVFFAGHMSGFPLRRVAQFLAGLGFAAALLGGYITLMP
jgi:hypothetical protein